MESPLDNLQIRLDYIHSSRTFFLERVINSQTFNSEKVVRLLGDYAMLHARCQDIHQDIMQSIGTHIVDTSPKKGESS